MDKTHRTTVFKNDGANQKLATVKSKTDIEEGDTVRIVGLGNFGPLDPEQYSGNYIHEDLRGALKIIGDAVDQLPEDRLDNMCEEKNFYQKFEEVDKQITELMRIVDHEFGVMDKQDTDGREKVIFKHEVKHVADQIADLEDQREEELEELREKLGIEKARWGRTVTLRFKDGTEEEASLPIGDDASEDAKEYIKRQNEIQANYEKMKKEIFKDSDFDYTMESRGREHVVYEVSKNGYKTEIPAYGPVNIEKESLEVEKMDSQEE